MKKVARAVIKAGCALVLLALTVGQPALAECTGLPSLFFGNLNAGAIPIDQARNFGVFTYIHQRPSINSGTADPGFWAFDGGAVGGIPGTTVVFADWAALPGSNQCPYDLLSPGDFFIPDNDVNQVFVGRDDDGVVCIAAKGGTNDTFPRDIDFDAAAGASGFAKSTLRPVVANAMRGAAPCASTEVRADLTWEALSCNVDAGSTGITAVVGSYGILLRRSGGGSDPLEDRDGSVTDTRAMVCFAQDAPGSESTGNLFVVANLVGSGGAPATSVTGMASTNVILDPLLADPHQRGRGKGLEKAPGLNR